MDPTAFDTLVRSLSTADTRRRLLGRLVAMLPVSGALLTSRHEAGAEHPNQRLGRRTPQRNRKQRNNNKNNNQNNKNQNKSQNNKGVASPGACTPDGSPCQQSSQCCSGNCFNFVCADMVTQCSAAGPVVSCTPPDSGGTGCCASDFACCSGHGNRATLAGWCV